MRSSASAWTRLVELVQAAPRERSQRFVGRTMEVLVEGPSRTDPVAAARPQPPQQGGQLRRHRRAGRDRSRSRSPRRPRRRLGGHELLLSRAGWRPPCTSLAIFGPTAVGKTGVAIALAERLRERGEDPVAVSCDAIQVYRGLEILSGAADAGRAGAARAPAARDRPDRRRVLGRPVRELAHAEIDELLADGRRPIVVGGTGLYLRAALADLEMRPPVPAGDPGGGRGRARASAAPRPSTPSSPRSWPATCTRTTASGSPGSPS